MDCQGEQVSVCKVCVSVESASFDGAVKEALKERVERE